MYYTGDSKIIWEQCGWESQLDTLTMQDCQVEPAGINGKGSHKVMIKWMYFQNHYFYNFEFQT